MAFGIRRLVISTFLSVVIVSGGLLYHGPHQRRVLLAGVLVFLFGVPVSLIRPSRYNKV
jgi:hypothetical protein